MTEGLLKILEALEKPLRFAFKNDYVNISKVKNLDQLVNDLTIKATSLSLSSYELNLVKTIKRSFISYKELELDSKKKLIEESLKVIDSLKSDKYSTYPHVSQKTGSVVKEVSDNQDLSQIPIQYLKGVGPRIAGILAKKGIKDVEAALYYFPRMYEDRRHLKKISELTPFKRETVMGKVILTGKVQTKRRQLFQVVVSDGKGRLNLVWFQFNEKYLRTAYKKDAIVILSGEITVDRYSDSLQIIHPRAEDVEIIENEENLEKDFLNFNRIVPIYPLTEGIKQRRLRSIMKTVIDYYSPHVVDHVPEDIKRRRRIMDLDEALSRVHFLSDSDRLVDLFDSASVYSSTPHRSVSFNEFFFMELGLALKKRDVAKMPGIAFNPTGRLTERLLSSLPFDLTSAQKRVISEIEEDMTAESPMNRLLQGDVGSGKTIVALLSMLKAVEGGYQAAIMAPTEILAEQHLRSILQFTSRLGVKIVLLTSGLSKKERDNYHEAIKSGEADIAIGTHALIEEGVEFKKLGLVVIDEQHRFGVMQRAELRSKGTNPDVLVMTATPIPRTLAMTVYGDLDVSVLDEMPPGRKPIKTIVFHEEKGARKKAYDIVGEEVKKGRQVYVVYPMIEESENPDFKDLKYATRMADELQNKIFPEFQIGLLHGRMKTEEKDTVMKRFISHDIDILVSTTVIEVGVDVPNATVMVVENAERFGLSQLHQLRGRIGRGGHESACILISGYKRSEEAKERLVVLEKTTDGFRIAEADLMIRGPGDFLGTKQSGLPEFRFANLIRDARILVEAREEAFRLVKKSPT
ncbi:MAG TPA: ATP-dependent DNA helicase RecG, partial [Thermodesulfobacteriota bacterium]